MIYMVLVVDPLHPEDWWASTIEAGSVASAERQAKDGYTGLLGSEETQKRLKVKVQEA